MGHKLLGRGEDLATIIATKFHGERCRLLEILALEHDPHILGKVIEPLMPGAGGGQGPLLSKVLIHHAMNKARTTFTTLSEPLHELTCVQ